MSTDTIDDSSSESNSEREFEDIQGSIINKHYIPLKNVYHGKYSSVWISINYNKKENSYKYCVLKEYASNDEGDEQAEDEIKSMEKVCSNKIPFTLKILDEFEENDHHYIIYPLLYGSLYEVIKKNNLIFSLTAVKKITVQLLLSLRQIHKAMGMVHLDIKPENILLNSTSKYTEHIEKVLQPNFLKLVKKNGLEGGAKKFIELVDSKDTDKSESETDEKKIDITDLYSSSQKQSAGSYSNCDEYKICVCDFGMCTKIKERHENHTATQYYKAPEDILEHKNKDESVDLWAVACTIYELLTGKILFDPDDSHINGEYPHHIYLIQTLIGPPSLKYLSECERRISYFKMDGRIKGWNTYEYVPLYKLLPKKAPSLNQTEINETCDFLMSIFKWDAKERKTIDELLKHKFIKKEVNEFISTKKKKKK